MATKRQLKKQDTMKAKAAQVVEEKAAEIKETTKKAVAEVKKVTEEKVAEVKEAATEKAVEVKKTTETKKAAPKKAAAKKEIKTTLIVEHQGKQVGDKEMVAAVKKAWTKSGKKIGDIKTMTLYVKPEEAAVYYVINDTETGKVEF